MNAVWTLLLALMLVCLAAHGITGYFDLKLAMATRTVTIFERPMLGPPSGESLRHPCKSPGVSRPATQRAAAMDVHGRKSFGALCMKPSVPRIAAAALCLASSALAQAPNQPGHESPRPGTNTEAVSATEDAVAGLVGRVSAEMTSTMQGFVTAAATSDMYEVAAGKLAMERARSAEVKAFARQMVEAHTGTTKKLQGLLAGGQVKATPPAALDNRRQGMLDNLKGASAADFDHRYIVQQIAAHREAQALFEGYAKEGDNAALKDFAATTAPTIRMHLSMAENLNRSVK
jgi:putative membrane protein